jgi:hypothetical protein
LWRRARAVPSLDLRFADSKSLVDAVTGASLVTFTRASSGTYVDSAGTLQTAATDAPRFDHNPTTGESLGLLVEEARTNLLLNSGTLSTQSATVTAVAHTLHFTGTGTITLTGASTAGPLVGTGTGEANRVSLTFTPTAGSLTLTVSGTVTNAQLEAGAFRTSYIATAGATATRAADVASITGSAFSSFYRAYEGTMFADVTVLSTAKTNQVISIDDGTTNNRIELRVVGATTAILHNMTAGGVAQNNGSITVGSDPRRVVALSYRSGDTRLQSGVIGTTLTGATVPTVTQIQLNKATFANGEINGTIRRFCYWPQRLPNSTLQSITL